MFNLPTNPEEGLKLLTELMYDEQRERDQLAQSLHHKTGGIAAMQLWFSLLETKLGKRDPTMKALKEALETSIEDLKVLTGELYPRSVFRQGWINALKEFGVVCMQTYEFEVVWVKVFEELPDIHPRQEAELFKVCRDIIDTLRQASCTKVLVELKLNDTKVHVKIVGKKALKESIANTEQIKRFRLIKARLMLLKAGIHSRTNWKTKVEFDLQLLSKNEGLALY